MSQHSPVRFPLVEWHQLTQLHLPVGGLHLWASRLDQESDKISKMIGSLSEAECHRADRFHFEVDRRRFVVSHAFLRRVLAAYLGGTPSEIEFEIEPQGKPVLAAPAGSSRLEFNLAHSGEFAVVGVAWQQLGVDIEITRDLEECETVAKRFFSSREYEALLALPSQERNQAFFRCWTRKEAFIKAVGQGLTFPLSSFDVTLAAGIPAAILHFEHGSRDARDWNLLDLKLADGVVGAAALPFSPATVKAGVLTTG